MEEKTPLAHRAGEAFVNWARNEYGLEPFNYTDALIKKAAMVVETLGIDETIAALGSPAATLTQSSGREMHWKTRVAALADFLEKARNAGRGERDVIEVGSAVGSRQRHFIDYLKEEGLSLQKLPSRFDGNPGLTVQDVAFANWLRVREEVEGVYGGALADLEEEMARLSIGELQQRAAAESRFKDSGG